MLKKKSWIVALLVALSLTAFFIAGCVNPLAVEEDTETYEEYVLDKGFNAWAGQVYQSGWAIGGIVFQGKGDALVTAKDLGYDIEMFQKARYLEIEMPDETYPRSGVDIIWGGEDATGKSIGMWFQQPIAGGSGDVDTTFAKKDGNKLRIDLTKALKSYSDYKASTTTKVKIVMQVNAPSYGNVEGLVKKATLLIPNTPPPSVGVDQVQLTTREMYWTNELSLEGSVIPNNATNQSIVWAIRDWTPAGDTVGGPTAIKLPELKLDDPNNYSDDPTEYANSSLGKYEAAQKQLFKIVNWKQEEYIVDDTVFPNKRAYRNVPGVLSIPLNPLTNDGKDSLGTVRVVATVKNGKLTSGNFSNFVRDTGLHITIKDPPDFYFKVGGVDQNTIWYGVADNKGGGASGGKMEVNVAPGSSPPSGTSFTSTFGPGGGYANSRHYFEVDLGSGKTLGSYWGVTLHIKGDGKDGTNFIGKSIRIRASATKPDTTSGYKFGAYIGTTSFSRSDWAADDPKPGLETDVTFEFFKDNAKDSDGDKKDGIFKHGVGSDLRTAAGSEQENADEWEKVKDSRIVYVWVLPWYGANTEFTVSDVKFHLTRPAP